MISGHFRLQNLDFNVTHDPSAEKLQVSVYLRLDNGESHQFISRFEMPEVATSTEVIREVLYQFHRWEERQSV